MRQLLVCLCQTSPVTEVLRDLADVLARRGVLIRGMVKNRLKFQPSSLMRKDIDFLVETKGYNFAKFNGVKFPTKKFSKNGKDDEYYLKTVGADSDLVLTVIVNLSQGEITVNPE